MKRHLFALRAHRKNYIYFIAAQCAEHEACKFIYLLFFIFIFNSFIRVAKIYETLARGCQFRLRADKSGDF